MLNFWIVLAGLILLGGLLYFENLENTAGKLATKTPLSALFIVAAVVQPHTDAWLFSLILLGLIFCLGGDVLLAIPSERTFMLGLFSFLMGHVFYVLAFLYLSSLSDWFSGGPIVIFAFSAAAFLWLRPHLGRMAIPVLAYVVVISLMVTGAYAVFRNPELSRRGALIVYLGALLFYFSDLFVARDRFIQPGYINRRLGLPMYYAGQFLLAFSLGQLP
ncbi:MAG: lysoplasmalogenase [Proteobacteria bacterium]|nr:lysoplasmalogenase [Pseudomonadota bacterium]